MILLELSQHHLQVMQIICSCDLHLCFLCALLCGTMVWAAHSKIKLFLVCKTVFILSHLYCEHTSCYKNLLDVLDCDRAYDWVCLYGIVFSVCCVVKFPKLHVSYLCTAFIQMRCMCCQVVDDIWWCVFICLCFLYLQRLELFSSSWLICLQERFWCLKLDAAIIYWC